MRLDERSCSCTHGPALEVRVRYSFDLEAAFLYWRISRWDSEGEANQGEEEERLKLYYGRHCECIF